MFEIGIEALFRIQLGAVAGQIEHFHLFTVFGQPLLDQLAVMHAQVVEGHLAYFIADTVESLDLSAFHACYANGRLRSQPFHPAMMVKVMVYGYATGVFSSRKLARRRQEDVALRVLAACNFPAHRTLSDFRALHLAELSALFEQVVKLAREYGLVKLGVIAVDGTKVKANASRHKAMSYGRMQQAEAELKQQIAALLERARATDAAEADEPEQDLPAEIARREARLAAIEAAKARLKAQQREADTARGRHADDECRARDRDGKPKKGKPYKRDFGVPQDSDQTSFTDPQSRIMKQSNGGFDYGYNAQTAVDAMHQIIVAAELTNCANDSGRLPSMVNVVAHTLGDYRSNSWPMRLITAKRHWKHWWESGAKWSSLWGSTPASMLRNTLAPRRWRRSCKAKKAKRRTAAAKPSWKRPTAGSRLCWASGSSVFGE